MDTQWIVDCSFAIKFRRLYLLCGEKGGGGAFYIDFTLFISFEIEMSRKLDEVEMVRVKFASHVFSIYYSFMKTQDYPLS